MFCYILTKCSHFSTLLFWTMTHMRMCMAMWNRLYMSTTWFNWDQGMDIQSHSSLYAGRITSTESGESLVLFNTLRPSQNDRRRYFSMHFLERKCFNSDWNIIEVCSRGSNWQYTNIGLDNGLCAEQATNNYLNQWWPKLPTQICVTPPRWFKNAVWTSCQIGIWFITQIK